MIVLYCLLLSAVSVNAAELTQAASGMVITADKMENEAEGNLIRATGNVRMTWQEMVMTSEQATYDRESKVMIATGKVVLVKAGDIMRGDKLTLDTETGRAEVENGNLFMKQSNFRMAGKQISRVDDDDYAMTDGSLTTCDAETPSWKFGSSELDATVDEYATGQHVVFYIKDIPVFYFPYLIFPVKKERQSGLLFPKFGSSSKKGLFLDIPFYWAISESQEATIDLDIQTKRGVGTGLDYRYLRKVGSTGSFGGYLIYDNNEKKTRGELLQYHQEMFSPDMSLMTSINLVSDKTFLSDYADKSGDYNRKFNDTRATFHKHWQTYAADASILYTQDLAAGSSSTTLQRLPELNLAGVREKPVNLPVYFDIDLNSIYFQREQGVTGARILSFPKITAETGLPGYLNLSAYAGSHLRGYSVNRQPAGTKQETGDMIPEIGGTVSTAVSRIYEVELGSLKKLRHELAPSVSYAYIPERDQTTVPFFDSYDRLGAQDGLHLAIASHLGGKVQSESGTSEYQNLFTMRLRQLYRIHGNQQEGLSQIRTYHHWANLVLESDIRLYRSLNLQIDAQYDPYNRKIASTAAGVEFNDQRTTLASLTYRRVDQQVEYLEARLNTKLLKPFYPSYAVRYSLDKHDVLESIYSMEYRHQCWSVIFNYTQRPGNQSFTVNFNLLGLFDNSPNRERTPSKPKNIQ
jgi:LPS-assembly protein